MVRQKINNLRQREGFTIVELLIVIVVIGILAAITIIAYNGITTKANGTNSRSNAETVQKIAEAYNADNGAYPTVAQILAYNGSTKLPTSLANGGASATANAGALTSGAGLIDGTNGTNCVGATTINASCLGPVNGTKDIIFVPNSGNTGDCIGWYDYANINGNGVGTQWVYAGAATTPAYVTTSKYTCT